ncbi:SMP-30/gluconolactonase/LRE family protein [Olivibacter sp. XZL3]|uniref:SMP-30/gluconolactonase/LRE family protein n=1 Tax=Olivibacter sp. XZL3 TaxID=1735116 RepID=UPI0010653060|nr:SMP-30/gluconolactonase/LRE family protein [Olivibacter sp. XZL3]
MAHPPLSIHILAQGIRFPEGPAFAPDGTLWCVEQQGESLLAYTNEGLITVHTGGRPNGLTFDAQGRLWFCDAGFNAIRVYDPVSTQLETVLSSIKGIPLNMPNDLAFDDLGNLVFTCPGSSLDAADTYVCCYKQDGQLLIVAKSLRYPNGLAFTPDGNQLVIAETAKHRLWIGTWHSETASWQNPRIFANTGGPIGPDGIAFDDEGNLYVAVYGSGSIRVFDPTGSTIERIPLPGNNPTNCAFDPSGKLGLIVTEAEKGQLLQLNRRAKGAIRYPIIAQRT